MPRTALFYKNQLGGFSTVEDMSRSTGNRFYVDSGASDNGDTNSYGQTPDAPFATWDFAISQCTANNGDIIYLMPGHAETVSAAGGLDFDVAGVKHIGLGNGTSRPTVTLGTLTTADVDIDAINQTIENVRFVSDINSLAVMIDVNFGNLHMQGCDFISSNTKEVVNFINLATTVDDFLFQDCYFYQPTDPEGSDNAAATGCFYIVDSENIFVERCRFIGFFETSIFHNKTTLCQALWVVDCYGSQELLNADVITLVDDAEGGMVNTNILCQNAGDVAEGTFMTLATTTQFGFFNSLFMNDNGGGGNLALAITADTT